MKNTPSAPRHWQLAKENWQLPAEGALMGILNCTPDSFSDGGQHNTLDKALAHARQLIQEGADIIDIGGESTRPGAQEISRNEEYARTIPLIKELRKEHPRQRLSIDTRHPEIAQAALEAGVDIINDITGIADPAMREICASYQCGIILMHMQGRPESMQNRPQYHNIIEEIRHFFIHRIEQAQNAGINVANICLDPGIGFGKTTEHNLSIIKNLEKLRPTAESPIMMALSRKRFMSEILDNTQEGRSTTATLTMSLISAQNGADLHRVHEIHAHRQALQLRKAYIQSQ